MLTRTELLARLQQLAGVPVADAIAVLIADGSLEVAPEHTARDDEPGTIRAYFAERYIKVRPYRWYKIGDNDADPFTYTDSEITGLGAVLEQPLRTLRDPDGDIWYEVSPDRFLVGYGTRAYAIAEAVTHPRGGCTLAQIRDDYPGVEIL